MNISAYFQGSITREMVAGGVAVICGGVVTAMGLNNAKCFNHQGKISYNPDPGLGTVALVALGALAAYTSMALAPNEQKHIDIVALKLFLFALPILLSLRNKTEILVSTSITKTNEDRETILRKAPYLEIDSQDLKDANGKIVRLMGGSYYDRCYQVNLAQNSFGIQEGYVPEGILDDLDPRLPLRLFYKGTPVEIIPNKFKCTMIRYSNSVDNWDPAGLLTRVDGSKIQRNANERVVELEFGENAILKKGYLPERFVRDLTPNKPLELKYRGREVLITMADDCANEAAPKPQLQPRRFTALNAEEGQVVEGGPSPEVIVQGPTKATAVEVKKPSVAPAILAEIPEKESGEVKITRAAMAVANSVEQLGESLPNYDKEFEKKVLAVINGQGSADSKDALILALVKDYNSKL